jgi:hypothetical protein
VTELSLPQHHYTTQVTHHNIIEVAVITCLLGEDKVPTLIPMNEKLKVTIGKEVISSGTTKDVYRVCL